jgi:membrane peptidoglycan carboxypeptidase
MRTERPSLRPDRRPINDRLYYKPVAILLLIPVIALGATLVAALLAPPFAGIAVGVRTIDARLARLGGDFTRIPKFPERSTIYANDGKTVLATVYLDNRELVKLKDISKVARKAVLAIEDESFYAHGALNFTSLARALVENARAGEIVQGGSTITQQLVKNTLGLDPTDRSLERKFQELALAMRVEQKYTKDEILELYLNQVYMGNGVYGFGTAAEFYFGKPAKRLSLTEGATLAGMIRAPEWYDPLDRPVKARVRRNDVLNRMMALGPEILTTARGERAKTRPLRLAEDVGKFRSKRPPFFVEYLRDQIIENPNGEFSGLGKTADARRRTLLEGGLSIISTFDANAHSIAQSIARRPYNVTPYHPPSKPAPDTAAVTIENETGAIELMLSGRNYRKEPTDLVLTAHEPGSSWKPFILAAAFEEGIPPTATYSSSSPAVFPEYRADDRGPWTVDNAEGSGQGLVNLWTATEDSINAVFARLIIDVGPTLVDDVAQRVMGIDDKEFDIPGVPSLATGSVGFSPLQMAQGYQTFANDGKHCQPYAVQSISKGREMLYEHEPSCKQVLDPDIAHQITAMLENVPRYGTAASAVTIESTWPVAGKTGTANENKAVWFVGYTKQLTTAVWVGSPGEPYSMGDVFGGTVAAPIWNAYMAQMMSGLPAIGFPEPPKPPTGPVPNVVGMKRVKAITTLGEAGFRVEASIVDSSAPKGVVISQAPSGGTVTDLGITVRIEVSNGVPPVAVVPRVVGLTPEKAASILKKAGFQVMTLEKVVEDKTKVGIVVFQQPGGSAQAEEGTTVTIYVGVKSSGGVGGGGGGG